MVRWSSGVRSTWCGGWRRDCWILQSRRMGCVFYFRQWGGKTDAVECRRADSIVDGQFVMPASPSSPLHRYFETQLILEITPDVKLTMQDFFQQLHEGAKDPTVPVLYLSSQNGNIRGAEGDSESEYAPLLDDVGAGPDWAREVFGQS